MTMPDVSGLPVNLDTTYDDDAGDASVQAHQQHHDLIHAALQAGTATYLTVVEHGATAGTARPTATLVLWVGTVDPTNAAADDLLQRTDTSALFRYDGAAWDAVGGGDSRLDSATVASNTAGQTTTSTTYTDLATVGPSVTVTTGTRALVFFTVDASNNTVGSFAQASFAVSGATTLAASGDYALLFRAASAGQRVVLARAHLIAGLTPGSNTFTLKYSVAISGTATYYNRQIVVIPL